MTLPYCKFIDILIFLIIFQCRPRAALLKNLQKRGGEFLTEETYSVVFDDEMQNDLLSFLGFYETTHTPSHESNFIPDERYKATVAKFAKFTFLSKKTIENSIIKPFFSLRKGSPTIEEDELLSSLFNFYHNERIATIKLLSFLLAPLEFGVFNPEIVALCRTTLKSILSRGLIENIASQLINLSSISLPTSISQESNNELAFLWIHQNIVEQKEVSKIIFELINAEFVKIETEARSKLILDLLKNNFGLDNFEKYNLDAETVILAREAFWFRQSAAIRILDLKNIISASVSSSSIITTLSPLKSLEVSKLLSAFKTELNNELTTPFKFSWSLLAGFLDSLDILENDELKIQYPKIASKCIDSGVFKIFIDLLGSSNFSSESAKTKTSIKSLIKDIYTSFLTIFDSERVVSHFPVLTEGLICIFSGNQELCEEFWYVDSQYSGRTSILKHWINRFPHDFIYLIRFLRSLSAGATSSEIVSDFLFKGFDHIYLERSSDRASIGEEFDQRAEVYNLTVNKAIELHSCGVGLILDSGSRGVMMSGFNERPMVNWSLKVYPFQFLLRILQISQDFSVNFSIMDLFESFMKENEDFAGRLHEHLATPSPVFSQAISNNLPLTLLDSLIFILEQPHPNAVIMSKCLNCLVHFDKTLNTEFFDCFSKLSPTILDGISKVLKRCIYNIEVDSATFEVFESVIQFSDYVLNICSFYNAERPEESSIIVASLKECILSFIIEHVGKWRFVSQIHRVRLLADVCRLVLALNNDEYWSFSSGITNIAFLNAIISLVHEISNDRTDIFTTSRIFVENKIDVGVYFECLTRTIESALAQDSILSIAEYFGGNMSTSSGLASPFSIIANCLSFDYLVLPVLLFFQYVFQNDQFSMNVRISRDSLEILSNSMVKWFKPESRNTLPRVRSAALAVLNNTACTRPDIFLFIFGQSEESFVSLFNDVISKSVFDHEAKLICGICSVLWNSVAEFTFVINALKRTKSGSDTLVEKMVKLLSVEWAESKTPLALQICSSVLEVLAVELCYFNLTQCIPKNISLHLKGPSFDPEKFMKKVCLFQKNYHESYLVFIESFTILASSCLALQDEYDFNRKLLPCLVMVLEQLIESGWKSNWQYIEMACKVLNFGLFSLLAKDNSMSSYSLLGHVNFNSLIVNFCKVLSSPCDDLSVESDQRVELVDNFVTLLSDSEFKWTSDQISSLFETSGSILNVLRQLLVIQSRDNKKISSYLRLLIVSLAALASSSDLIHFIRREGVLKTIFSLIRNYSDVTSLILFTSKIAIKFDFIVEELLSSEILDSFIINCSDSSPGNLNFFLEFISLLSIIKIQFDSNCAVSERICTILYGCNIQGAMDAIKKRCILEKQDCSLLTQVLPLFKLLSSSLNRPIESQATEALLTNLLPGFFDVLLKLTSTDDIQNRGELSELLESLVSTLATFNIHARSKYPLRRLFQSILFPLGTDHRTFSSSQFASALNFIIISSKSFSPQIIESCKQILRVNCPPTLLEDLEKSLATK